MSALVSRRQAVACAGAVLYPYGAAAFGGPIGWHSAGLAAVAAGILMAAGVLGLLRVPVVRLATLGPARPARPGAPPWSRVRWFLLSPPAIGRW